MVYQVFISHSHVDKELAMKIKELLKSYSLDAFVAHEDIAPNAEWVATIFSTAKESQIFIYLLSENFYASESRWPDHEIGIGIGKGSALIPISIDNTTPYGALSQIQKARLVDCGPRDKSLCIKSGRENIDLSFFVIKQWHEKEPTEAVEHLIRSLGTASSFRTGEKMMELIVKFDEQIGLTREQLTDLVGAALSNNQIFHEFVRTTSRDAVLELINKYETLLDGELVSEARSKKFLY